MALFVAFIIFIVVIRLPWVWWWEKVHRFSELQKRAIDAEEMLAQQKGNAAYASFDDRRRSTKLVIYGVSTFICFVYVVTCAALIFTFQIKEGQIEYSGIGAWGPVGDFFGGMLNPVLAFASFMALLYTIRIQSEELRLTREELKRSSESQKIIAETAKSDLEMAQHRFDTQVGLQIMQPFLIQVTSSLSKIEEITNRKVMMHNEREPKSLHFVISKYADVKNSATFSRRMAHDLVSLSYSHGVSSDEVSNNLLEMKEHFLTCWQAILNIESLLIESGLNFSPQRLLGLYLDKVAKSACYLHVTGTFVQSGLFDVDYVYGSDPLTDDFVRIVKHYMNTLDTSKH